MSFWIRHTVVLVLCVLAPFSAAMYLDTVSTVDKAKEASRRSLQLAIPGLQLILQNEAYRAVSAAMSYAQRVTDDGRFSRLLRGGSKGEGSAQQILQLLNEATPVDGEGFAWLVDNEGRILMTNGKSSVEESPRSIVGHPIFVETQLGYALDGIWSSHRRLVQVAAAPLVEDGEIKGAFFVGRAIGQKAVREWAETLNSHVTLTSGHEVIVSSATDELARTVVDAAYDAVSPEYAGQSEESLTDATFSFLPLLIDHRVSGEAFISFGTPVLGAPARFQWVISIDAASGLSEVAERQSVVLGAMVASFLIALLVGILNYRSYVVPPDQIAAHLSQLQMGRGDLDMPEMSVSRPFRRLVRLINMTVQKLPNRGVPIPTADLSSVTRPPGLVDSPDPFADLPATGASSLMSSVGAMSSAPAMVSQPSMRAPSRVAESRLMTPDAGGAGAFEDDDGEIQMAPEPIDGISLDSLPDAPATVDAPVANGGVSFEQSEETEAAVLPTVQDSRGLDLSSFAVPPTPGAEAAIAEAIAQLEGAQQAAQVSASPGDDGQRRSAADIRGRPMGSRTPSGPFEEVSAPPSGPFGVRGGGSLDLRQSAALPEAASEAPSFGPEETVVAPVATELLAQSAREDLTGRHAISAPTAMEDDEEDKPDATVIANVPADLLAQSARDGGERPPPRASTTTGAPNLDADDRAHFEEVYERFLDLRRRCGEPTADLAFDRFLAKLARNREALVKKYSCRTVRFQVYKKDGKAALKATPVGGR